ncbi:non-canonical purine NTP pyrophosphatase [Anaerocolumna xylanovorans]|uniref:XTP/dITP diphosphohydrolase n=1 Tax=Anaerocolumna xylanovorans DSM 12503 TaxID=1121345 RepID=A0A1M7Y1J5_9FIRM|nr:non-canonical purine NTP pyrophosphatase [Anaerocolumna xylanovorans]SHO45615.1 XTP/dITP diphosphohydrolase [Anaerocolumna xylanovorans DSM 12503]
MKILYGTGNQGKLEAMRRALKGLDLEISGLKEYSGAIPKVAEDGLTPLDNARLKAIAYYKAFHVPVFSCDSGLYFEGLPEDCQPGVHVRRINGKELNDAEMIEYYSSLAKCFGKLKARYKNAVCFVLDEEHIYESMADNLSGESFYLVDTPHSRRAEGFPLDSLSVHIESGLYYYDRKETNPDELAMDTGFYEFFQKIEL